MKAYKKLLFVTAIVSMIFAGTACAVEYSVTYMVDSKDPQLQFSTSGWYGQPSWPVGYDEPSGGRYGGGTKWAQVEGAWVSLTFDGTGVTLIGEKTSWSGSGNVYLDGELVATLNFGGTGGPHYMQVPFPIASGLNFGEHTVKLVKLGAGWGDFISLDAFKEEVGGELEDSKDTQFAVSASGWYGQPSWPVGYDEPAPWRIGGGAKTAQGDGASVTVTFCGTAVILVYEKTSWSGWGNVYLDGELYDAINFGGTGGPHYGLQVYVISGLDVGPHTVAVVKPAGQGWIIVDAFLVVEADADGDGVTDCFDICPNTGPGEPVDANGCSDLQAIAEALGSGESVADILEAIEALQSQLAAAEDCRDDLAASANALGLAVDECNVMGTNAWVAPGQITAQPNLQNNKNAVKVVVP